MNALLTVLHGLPSIADLPVGVMLLVKLTALLAVAWLIHLALARANPRWRVLLWRITAVGLIAIPAVGWLFPLLEIRVARPTPVESLTTATPDVPRRDLPADFVGFVRLTPGPSQEISEGATPASSTMTGVLEMTSSDVAPADSSYWGISAATLFVSLWLAVVALAAARLLLGHRQIGRTIGRAGPAPDWVLDECRHVAEAIGCIAAVRVLQSPDVESPFLCGLWRPTLLLPSRACEPSYRADLPGIFAHELAHVRSADLPWNLLLHAISIVGWFHPLAWRMRSAHLAACELVCDAVSASFVGDVTDYCRTLARVAVDARAALPASGIAMARTSSIGHRLSALKRRVFDLPLRRRHAVAFTTTTFAAIALLGALRFALADPPPAETPGALQVHVVDEAGKPIAGAKLHAMCRGRGVDGVTDADGACAMDVPAPDGGPFQLFAEIKGFVPLRRCWANEEGREPRPEEFTFKFENGRTIGGAIHDEQGKPIEGAKVRLSVTQKDYEATQVAYALWDRDFSTDAQGRWQVDHMPEQIGSIAIQLKHQDYVSDQGLRQMSDSEQKQIQERTSILVMNRGVSVTGTVTNPDGKPVADARVSRGTDWNGHDDPVARTDATGRYSIACRPGHETLTVVSPGLAPAIRDVEAQPRMPPVDFQLEKGNTLRVRVVDKEGRPIEGAHVSTDTWRRCRTLMDIDIAKRTDAEGRWSWNWAPSDAVELHISKEGYMDTGLVPLAAQANEHVVTLRPRLTISGQVIDAQTKQPIPSFLALHGYIPGGDAGNKRYHFERREFLGETVQGKNGQYKIVVKRPSDGHVVRIEADGYQPVDSRQLHNDEGSVTCDFALTKGNALIVPVRLPDGKRAAGADVGLFPEEPGKFFNMATFVKNGRFAYRDNSAPALKVNADGQLTIEPQDNEFLLVVVHDQGFAKTTSKDLAAKPEITLAAWGRLEGTVLKDGKPVPNAKLDAYPQDSDGARWGFLNFQEQTEADADGKYAFPKLKPGRWNVRLLPVDPSGRSPSEKAVEIEPGQTTQVTLGGEKGNRIAGRIQWPDGKRPQRDLSKITAGVRPKMPQSPPPPKEVIDQGPDAVRAWHKQWQQSDEGKAWREQLSRYSGCLQLAMVSGDGSFVIEPSEPLQPGKYEFGVYIQVQQNLLPWEQPDLLQYKGQFDVPEIPADATAEPLDVGTVALEQESIQKPSGTSVAPPPLDPGQKTVGGLRDNVDLLRYVAMTYKQNKEKILSWQGKATIDDRSSYQRDSTGQSYVANVQFVFDRAEKSIRWNETLEKWTKTTKGQDEAQPVPQIINGMMAPGALYRLGQHDSPGNPTKRPLVLTIYPLSDPSGRLQTQLYDFNPLFFLDTFRGDVARDLSAYIGLADKPGLATMKIIREGDLVTVDMGNDEVVNRYTLSLSQGCNPVSCASVSPGMASEWQSAYESVDGVWLPKTWTYKLHHEGVRDEERTVTFVEHQINRPIESGAFALYRLDIMAGDRVQDHRTNQNYVYLGENQEPQRIRDGQPIEPRR